MPIEAENRSFNPFFKIAMIEAIRAFGTIETKSFFMGFKEI
jgi:hypothetical protein